MATLILPREMTSEAGTPVHPVLAGVQPSLNMGCRCQNFATNVGASIQYHKPSTAACVAPEGCSPTGHLALLTPPPPSLSLSSFCAFVGSPAMYDFTYTYCILYDTLHVLFILIKIVTRFLRVFFNKSEVLIERIVHVPMYLRIWLSK